MPRLAAYEGGSAAKSAVVGYIRALAADLAGTGVTANVVCPGSTRGPMLAASAAVYDLPDQETFAAQALLRRLLEPGEVAAAVAWLCGPDSGALTGAVIPVDPGRPLKAPSAAGQGYRAKSRALDQPIINHNPHTNHTFRIQSPARRN